MIRSIGSTPTDRLAEELKKKNCGSVHVRLGTADPQAELLGIGSRPLGRSHKKADTDYHTGSTCGVF